MPAPHCLGAVKFTTLAVARLDALGAPAPGATGLYVSDAGVTFGIKPNVTEGEALTQKNGSGGTCVNYQECDRVERVDLSLPLCQWDVELAEILNGGVLEQVEGVSVGYQLPDPGDTCPNGVVIEAFALAWDGNERAAHPVSGDPAWWRYRFPKVTWAMGDAELGNAVATPTWNGKAVPNNNVGLGPFGDWPAAMNGPMAWDLVDTVPTVECGYQVLEPVAS